MARYIDVHPENPQPRVIEQLVALLKDDALIALPTDSGYALVSRLDNHAGKDRILNIRDLDDKHHFTLLCKDFSQLGQFVKVDNHVFRSVKGVTPGPYTFVLEATREVPRRLMHPKKKTVGVRIPDHAIVHALVDAMGEPLMASTLILPGEEEPRSMGWDIKEELDHLVEAVVEAGECPATPTTVVDYSDGTPVVVRRGAGDPDRFEA
ncbi:L-threonylcarbamoyladenylate synthase [Nocardioides cavernaquae]|uniref:Threonylcarbamoyl-AMP synthase n=1 Tax=Nocardioides cavernaquae TaxID=2321396 RepID=A0A3A5H5M3_9ACTN|nr:L-threonylcarbamoyladenylate synthase [Nocardioides cavernaquae]RJS45221.1 threonylcarbamoyl-AMP synthase [Nocardioides cavernaquae]